MSKQPCVVVRYRQMCSRLAGLALLMLIGLAWQPSAAAPPNVLLIVVDDLRAELGSYGNPIMRTPNIDRLASSGVKFTSAFSQFPLCNPSRASFLLGRYPANTGVSSNSTNFRQKHPNYVTLPQYFLQNGYDTISIGKVFHVQDPVSWTKPT